MTDSSGQTAGRTLAEAAPLLGVSERTLRRWIAGVGGPPCTVTQAGYPPFTVERRGAGLVVLLPENVADTPADMSANGRTTPDSAIAGEVAQLRAQLAATLHERDALATDKAWLQERLERAEEERAELRRMLNLEQQTLATLGQPVALTAPAPVAPEPASTRAEGPVEGPTTVRVSDDTAAPSVTAVERQLKRAGVGKKARRRLMEQLAAVFRR